MNMKFSRSFPVIRFTEAASCCRSLCSSVPASAVVEKVEPAKSKSSPSKKYSESVILPKTDFPIKVSHEKRNEHELKIASKFQFDQLYGLQRLWREEQPEFILHDGPPYANGDTHIGHAVNKILKDVTNRYKLMRGFRVNYSPGWDCHGLPIELKALKDNKFGFRTDPLQIRNAARIVSEKSIQSQMESFRRWGVMAEWQRPYKTTDRSYVQTVLRLFYELHQKGFVYREQKPVYWSPSSGSALAEAELEYNAKHESTAIHLALDLSVNLEDFLAQIGHQLPPDLPKDNGPIKAVVWTTTPWTLPGNKAVAFKEDASYSLVFSPTASVKTYYIVAASLVPQFVITMAQEMRSLLEFKGKKLENFHYKHPWFDNLTDCPLVHSDHVTLDKGTGLVHIAPAHGHDDYVLGLNHKLKMDCYVDSEGNFTSDLETLKGQPVLTAGNNSVVKTLNDKILHKEKFIHPYPYDWRTKKPVILKTSMQWFIDTEKLKKPAAAAIENLKIFPKNVQNGLIAPLLQRPYWCISRQRVWGIPIPVLYKKETGEPIVNKEIVERLCDLVELSGNADAWWDVPISTLMNNDKLSEEYEKGKDIFDIWLDSGVSWHLLDGKEADLYLEGKDQFQGWFQSSLLTSVALKGRSPYKNLFVHGFVVDNEGRKMSKSVGNVTDPSHIIEGYKEKNLPAYGADVLRWWASSQGAVDGSNIAVSYNLLRSSDENIQKLRNVLRFLLCFCNDSSLLEQDIDDVSYEEMMYVDQYMLHLLNAFQKDVTEQYDEFNYHRVLMKTLHFATSEVSAQYFMWVKDRLYCDSKDSQSRKSCVYVLNQIYLTMAKVLAPVLPFLVQESYAHYSESDDSVFKIDWFDLDEKTWENPQVNQLFELVNDVRTTLNHLIGSNNPKDVWVELVCNKITYDKLRFLQTVDGDLEEKCDSELTDILQVSGISLRCYEKKRDKKTGSTSDNPEVSNGDGVKENIKFLIAPYGVGHSQSGYSVGISKTELLQCARCRRHSCLEGGVLCNRCASVLKHLQQQSKNGNGNGNESDGNVSSENVAKKMKLAT